MFIVLYSYETAFKISSGLGDDLVEHTDGFVETAECRTQQETTSQYGNVVINALTDKVSTFSQWPR